MLPGTVRRMMRRCGWGTKEGPETVPAVEISRAGFGWALRNACLSHCVPGLHEDRGVWSGGAVRR